MTLEGTGTRRSPVLGVGQFLAVGLAVVGLGVGVGLRRHLRSERFTVHLREHATPIGVASKALMYGTALCAASTCVAIGAGCILTGIYSPAHFDRVVRAKLSALPVPEPGVVDEEAEKLTRYLSGEDDDEGEEETDEKTR